MQDQVANPHWVPLAGSGNLNDLSGHNFRHGIAPIDQLEGCANGFEGGRYGLDRLGVKSGFL
jgi:hypothetical protein